MKYYLSLILIFLYRLSFAQEIPEKVYPKFSLTAQAGFSKMTGLPKNIDEQMSFGSSIRLHYNLQLTKNKKPFYLTSGIGYERYRYITDGMFNRNNEGYFFVPTPNDYKQHEIDMQFLHVPLLFKFVPFHESATSIGFYGNYLLKAKSKYKIGADKFSAEAPVENKFQFGLAFDQEFILFSNKQKKTSPVLGFGANYQLSKFISDNRSFKPLSGYVKIGIALW
jgi:hypothetical protein